MPIFARIHFHSGHYHGGNGGPVDDWIGGMLARVHDTLPGFLPEWMKWTIILLPPVLVLAWLIVKWQRWMGK